LRCDEHGPINLNHKEHDGLEDHEESFLDRIEQDCDLAADPLARAPAPMDFNPAKSCKSCLTNLCALGVFVVSFVVKHSGTAIELLVWPAVCSQH
jgi:hypothetical protein